jgi:hypothetical protein
MEGSVRACTDNEIRARAKLTVERETRWLEPWRLARLDQVAAACDRAEGMDMYRMALALLEDAPTGEDAQTASDMAYVAALVLCRPHSPA